MKRVVVAIDGSEVSKGVVDYAIHYANREKDAEMLFLHVVEPSEQREIFYRGHVVSVPPSPDDVRVEFQAFIKARMDAVEEGIPKMSVSLRSGSPYEQIVKFAEEENADIIMIGHRGLGNVQRFFLGSVAAKVVAHAPCSVYVHRPKKEKAEG
ncbi:MAG: universal stress protein [Synergistales bacterium]